MKRADHRSPCHACGSEIVPGERITMDEAGEWVHAEGCTLQTETWFGGLFTGRTERMPGYRGKAPAPPCPHCHLSPCDCDYD